jgi:hypothetical protein
MKLTNEQRLGLENKHLKQMIADMLYALQDIAQGMPRGTASEVAKNAITKAAGDYQKYVKVETPPN